MVGVIAQSLEKGLISTQGFQMQTPVCTSQNEKEDCDDDDSYHGLIRLRGGDDDFAKSEGFENGVLYHLGLVAKEHGDGVDDDCHQANGGNHGHVE